MVLTLGNPNFPGTPEHVRRAGRLLLLWLLPYFALAIIDGCFLPLLVHYPTPFWAYDITKIVLIPAVYLLFFQRYLYIRPDSYFFTGRRNDFKGWELGAITFWWSLILYVVYFMGETLVDLLLVVVFSPLHWMLSHWMESPDFSFDYPTMFSYGAVLPDGRILRAVVAIFFSITAGVVEEIFYRGLLRQAIAAILGPRAVKTYIIVSALVFGLAHWEQGSTGLSNATVFGVCAA